MDNKKQLFEYIESRLKESGASIVGFADLRRLPSSQRSQFPFALTIAVSLDSRIVENIVQGPTNEYYEEYIRVNESLDKLGSLAERLMIEKGYRSKALMPTGSRIDLNAPVKQIPHKTVATLAGLGWIGKCALLIVPSFGSAFRLTSVLTDAELPVGEPVKESQCGECIACIEICPGKAPTGESWKAGIDREVIFNATACRTAARKLALENIGIQTVICGMCIAACPWTQAYIRRYK